jgi:hypothetical protein
MKVEIQRGTQPSDVMQKAASLLHEATLAWLPLCCPVINIANRFEPHGTIT